MRRRAVLCAAILVGITLSGCSGQSSSHNTAGQRSSAPVPHPPAAEVRGFPRGAAARPATQGQPPAVPASGAYLGAWVQPKQYVQPDREAAVADLEAQLGRRLDIVHTYRTIDEAFPTPSDLAVARAGSYLMLSWAMPDTEQVVSGRYDAAIRQLAQRIQAFRAPVFLEPRWEMDRPNLTSVVHSPTDFVAAWQHVHAIFDTVGVPNASWVWCPTATGFATGRAPGYYPGDDEVDWVCADAYPGPQTSALSTVLAPFLAWVHQHTKPAMIGEFGITRDVSPDQRAAWLDAAEATVRANTSIKAVVYFDSGLQGAPASSNYLLAGDAPTLNSYRTWARAPYFDTQHLVSKGDT
jgi:hypothetical protein